jgi:hypothetical protein
MWGIVHEKVGFKKQPETLYHAQYPTFSTAITLHTHSPMKMEQTESSETLAFITTDARE